MLHAGPRVMTSMAQSTEVFFFFLIGLRRSTELRHPSSNRGAVVWEIRITIESNELTAVKWCVSLHTKTFVVTFAFYAIFFWTTRLGPSHFRFASVLLGIVIEFCCKFGKTAAPISRRHRFRYQQGHFLSQGCTHFWKIWAPHQNSRRQNGDRKQVPH